MNTIHDRSDATTKDALQPLLDVFNRGSQGVTSQVLADQVSATMALVMTCAAAGSSSMPSTSHPSASGSPGPSSATNEGGELSLGGHQTPF